MRLLIGNVVTEVIIGGKDNLLPFDLQKELDKYLSVSVPGAFFARKKSGNKWDGKKHFLIGNKFPSGFLPHVLKFCSDRDIVVSFEDKRNNVVTFKKEFQTSIGGLDMREYQIDVATIFLENKLSQLEQLPFPRGIINAATNSGKTSIVTGVLANIENPKALFMIHSQLIYDDAVEHFSKFFKVGQINSKHYDIQEVTIAMVKSLYSKAKKSINVYNDLKQFNTVIVDEAHRAGGVEYSEILRHVDAYVRMFMSGTALKNTDKLKNLYVIAGSGSVLYTIRNSEMIEKGVSRRPIVYIHRIVHKKKKLCFSYEDEKEWFINRSVERAEKVVEIVAHSRKSTLVAFINYEAGEKVYGELAAENNVGIVDGKSKNRKKIIEDFANGELTVLVGSVIMKEGLNLPNIQRLIMYTGGMSEITVLQFVGRALRAKQGEETVEIHDFYDEGEHLSKHSRKRINMYLEEGFEVKEVEYDAYEMKVVKEYKPRKKKA